MPVEIETSARIFVVMGVAGCGKSSVGAALAGHDGVAFLDGDDFHPAANVAKMTSGTPLTDADRWPWLDTLGVALSAAAGADGRVYAACSALRRAYRGRLIEAAQEPIHFLHLNGTQELIGARMAAREGHYMPATLLDSQFATLEPLEAGEAGSVIEIDAEIDVIVAQCQRIVGARR